MKNIFSAIAILLMITFISSCEKDEGKLPNISFKTTSGYTSADKSVSTGDTITVGINASKAEDKDVLKTFDGSKTFNGGTATSFYSETLSGTQGDSYSKELKIVAGSTAGAEKYTFTVVNKDGLKNAVSLTLTVN